MSVADEFSGRRRRYLIMMAARGVCVIGAASTYRISGWIAALFMVGALTLPWIAVLIANDRPPKQAVRFRRFVPGSGSPSLELTDGGTTQPEPPGGASAAPGRRSSTIIDL